MFGVSKVVDSNPGRIALDLQLSIGCFLYIIVVQILPDPGANGLAKYTHSISV